MGLIKAMRWFFYGLLARHNNIANDFGITLFNNYDMNEALKQWDELYRTPKGMQFASVIASEVARLATLEFEVDVDNVTARGDIIKRVLKRELSNNLRKQVEYGCAYGSLLIKPNFDGKSISIDHIKPNCFIPVEFDSNNRLTSVICLDRRTIGDYIYTKAELCTYKNNRYTVSTRAYVSKDINDFGIEIPLTDVEEWKGIKKDVLIQNVDRPLFGLFRYPAANNIDIDSPLGVSIFSRSCDALQKLDVAFDKFNNDIDTSDKVLFVADYLLMHNEAGKKMQRTNPLPKVVKSLNFVTNGTEVKEWVPEIRDVQYKSAIQMYIDIISIQCGFDAGYFTFDNSSRTIKTATEVTADQQRTLSTVADVQIEIHNVIEDVIYAINALISLYKMTTDDVNDVAYTIKYKDFNLDPEQERNNTLLLIEKGILPKWKYLVDYEGYTEEKAKELIEQIGGTKNG